MKILKSKKKNFRFSPPPPLRIPGHATVSYLQFRTVVARAFMARHDREDSDDIEDEHPKKLCKVVPVLDLSIRKISAKHLLVMTECKHAMRCRACRSRNGCSGKSRVRCRGGFTMRQMRQAPQAPTT